ncbi:CrcB-like protein-domain-containing protein [Geopyxis carbonaria]|nr:CrcB-like protein-domain-containing protein [Geopyxis carbonaria]
MAARGQDVARTQVTDQSPPAARQYEQSEASITINDSRVQQHPSFTLLHTTAYLTLFSILGTLSRLGLSALTTYPSSPLGGVVWANFAGSLIMGLLADSPTLLSTALLPRAQLPLYLGLTTGYCGSLTSFSSFILAAFEQLAHPPGGGRGRGHNALGVLGYVLATLCLSLGGLQLGAHLATVLGGAAPKLGYRAHAALNWGAVPLAAGMWGGAAALAAAGPRSWRGEATLACVFAPFGVYARFWVSRWANPVLPRFPLGTWGVNVGGTAVLAAVTVGRGVDGGLVGCELLRGVGDGFCGCLTTVSTFVLELRGLRLRQAYVYGAASVAAAGAVMVLILGSW